MPKRSSTDRKDPRQLAKSIIDQTHSEAPIESGKSQKNKAAQELGRLGGLKGGKARAKKLTAEERSEIARKAALTRWSTKRSEGEEQRHLLRQRHVIRPEPDD